MAPNDSPRAAISRPQLRRARDAAETLLATMRQSLALMLAHRAMILDELKDGQR